MSKKDKNRAVFIDRDGVINKVVYRGGKDVCGKKIIYSAPWKYKELKINENVIKFLCLIKDMNFLRILITNQPDIRYGLLKKREHNKIMKDILSFGFEDVFICLHGRSDSCACKKPKPGMLINAAKKWNIDFYNSYMIGDTESDMMAGKAVGCKTILVKNRQGSISDNGDFVVDGLLDVIEIIKKNERR